MELEKIIDPGNFLNIIDASHAMIRTDILPQMTLMPHQRAAIAQIMWAEANYKILNRRANVYAENLGAGKTRVALGVVALQPIPPVFMPEIYQFGNITAIVESTNRRFLRQTIIIVKSDVFEAWRAEIQICLPKAVVAYLSNAKTCYEYLPIVDNNYYDIVLVKANKMTAKMDKHVNIVDILADSLPTVVSRVIIDDYEQLSNITKLPKAISYLAISTTTRRNPTVTYRMTTFEYAQLFNKISSEFDQNIPCIRCEGKTLKQWLALPSIEFRRVVMRAPFSVALSFGKMDGEIGEIVSALASDAYNKASKLLGITATTPADIYQALLGKFYDRLNNANRCIERLNAVVIEIKRLAGVIKERPPFTDDMAEIIRRWVQTNSEKMPKLIPADGFSTFYKEYSQTLREELLAAKTEINVVKQSLAKQQCEVCNAEIGEDLAAVIVKCCSKMSCIECVKRVIIFWQKRRAGGNVCPFNAQHALSPQDIVYISEKTDFQLVLSGDITSKEEIVDVRHFDEKKDEPLQQLTKVDAILDIIAGNRPGEVYDIKINGLTYGDVYIAPPQYKKIVIFVGWEETLSNLTKVFDEKDICYSVLNGSSTEIQKKIDKFHSNIEQKVLLVNSVTHVSGYNLQFATDLIFYGRILSSDVLSQAAGRIQRIGRAFSATIWQLLYTNED